MRNIRRLNLIWFDKEVSNYETLINEAAKVKEDVPEYVKNVF